MTRTRGLWMNSLYRGPLSGICGVIGRRVMGGRIGLAPVVVSTCELIAQECARLQCGSRESSGFAAHCGAAVTRMWSIAARRTSPMAVPREINCPNAPNTRCEFPSVGRSDFLVADEEIGHRHQRDRQRDRRFPDPEEIVARYDVGKQ